MSEGETWTPTLEWDRYEATVAVTGLGFIPARLIWLDRGPLGGPLADAIKREPGKHLLADAIEEEVLAELRVSLPTVSPVSARGAVHRIEIAVGRHPARPSRVVMVRSLERIWPAP